MVALENDRVLLYAADLTHALSELPEASVDAVVTDPPYELGFMGKSWDSAGVAYSMFTWKAVLRVLKPGGYLLAFGGTRTYHRMACAIEDAGFEIRDSILEIYSRADSFRALWNSLSDEQQALLRRSLQETSTIEWMYGTGFPKSLNLGDGRGTALKPGHEPVVMARKPLTGTVAANVAEYGTGALNIDGCRIGGKPRTTHAAGNVRGTEAFGGGQPVGVLKPGAKGRWPANVLLDEGAAEELDAQSGTLKSGKAEVLKRNTDKVRNTYSAFQGQSVEGATYGDSGGASRFFYVAKPSRKERDYGCEHLTPKSCGEATDRAEGSAGVNNPRAGAGRTGGARNFHPTVKPIDLMRYLVRLVTPPGGVVLDPFTGSGTTGIAALREGFDFIGVEREAEYVEIAKARLQKALVDAAADTAADTAPGPSEAA